MVRAVHGQGRVTRGQLPSQSTFARVVGQGPGGEAFEVTVYRRSPGILDVAGRACGCMESWQTWSSSCGEPSQRSGEVADWRPVHKRRRISRFSLASEPVLARGAAQLGPILVKVRVPDSPRAGRAVGGSVDPPKQIGGHPSGTAVATTSCSLPREHRQSGHRQGLEGALRTFLWRA